MGSFSHLAGINLPVKDHFCLYSTASRRVVPCGMVCKPASGRLIQFASLLVPHVLVHSDHGGAQAV